MATLPLSPQRTPSFLRSTNIPSPALLEAMKTRPFTIAHDDPLVFRDLRAKHLASLRHLMPLSGQPVPEVSERDVYITVRDGAQIRVRVYTPVSGHSPSSTSTTEPISTSSNTGKISKDDLNGRPLILMFHEGGWLYGDLTDEEMNCRLFARDLGCVVGNVEYRLAPEHHFPTWTHDAWDVTRHFAQNAALYGADPLHRGFIVGGSSAGGNLSAVLAQLSRLENLQPPITGQYLSVPVIFPIDLVPERYREELLSPWENMIDPVLKGPGVERLKRHLEVLGVDPTSVLYTPLAVGVDGNGDGGERGRGEEERGGDDGGGGGGGGGGESYGKMAPAYFQIAGLDPLRDHGLIYERILRNEYRVDTKVDLYPGWGHMFWTNWPDLKESHDFVADTVRGVRWLLERVDL